MKERIHEQISGELKQASRNDTTITIIAIVVTFILFGISLAFASSAVGYRYMISYSNPTMSFEVYATAAMFVSLIAIMVINSYSIFALRNKQKRKAKLIESLTKLYQEEGITQYSVDDISPDYKAKANLFIAIIATVAATGIIIPIIVFINNIVVNL
jgi:hypothetical protein